MSGQDETEVGPELHQWPDAALARRCALQPPDNAAWNELWGRFFKLAHWKIRRTAPRLTDAVADELVSETFKKVFQSIGEYDPEGASLSTFILTIARNLAFDALRKRRLEASKTQDLETSPKWATSRVQGQTVPLDYLAIVVERAEKQLGAGNKLIVFNELIDGLKVADIVRKHAGERGWSESTVRRIEDECIKLISTLLSSLSVGEA
jgi:RNA polymerase sigma factor (sigma-70 family)